MSALREHVIIKTATVNLSGELFVGADGLPELLVDWGGPKFCRPWTLPAAWTICPTGTLPWGVLYDAWTDIEAVLQDTKRKIQEAQRDAATEDCDRAEVREFDAIDAYKRDAEARGER